MWSYFTGADTKPVFEFVVAECPVKTEPASPELADVADISLRSNTEFIAKRGRHIEPSVGKSEAAFTGVHRQIVVLIGKGISLGSKTVHLKCLPVDRELI